MLVLGSNLTLALFELIAEPESPCMTLSLNSHLPAPNHGVMEIRRHTDHNWEGEEIGDGANAEGGPALPINPQSSAILNKHEDS
jgi:hypothetical protein